MKKKRTKHSETYVSFADYQTKVTYTCQKCAKILTWRQHKAGSGLCFKCIIN